MTRPTATAPDLDLVREAIAEVPDPELPPVTLGMLGMIHDVRHDPDRPGHVLIELLPTFSGCPATEMMGRDVEAAVREVPGVEEISITWRYSPAWSSTRITEEGHERLREFGIAPPGPGPASTVAPEGRTVLPVMVADAPRTDPVVVACPYCGSEDTERESAFGPTPCRDIRYCHHCEQPFERFKDL
jgi:ring-1,2-phenylacetyl-CoA epoxidase subunit PaaD